MCCVAAVEVKSGREIKLWTEHGAPQPFDTGPDNLFVAHYSSAEWLSFLTLGWEPPTCVIDTYVEGRRLTNGLPGRKDGKKPGEGQQRRCGLLNLAARYGISSMSDAQKDAGRKLAMKGGPWTEAERREMMDYCLEDVRTCRDVFLAMLPEIVAPQHGLAQALLRGRVMRACARIEHTGIPVDLELLRDFEANWPAMRRALIEATDPGRYDCFEDGVFKRRRFEALLARLGISRWPRTETGQLSLKDRVWREQIVTYPELGDLHELYATLQQMKSFEISVGPDGRHRPAMLSPFGTDTARHNAGKARKEDKGGAFIFGLARWFRGLIKPGPGMAVVYSDFAAEEIFIAAWLSRDPNLLEAVRSGDPYIWFLKAIGMIPRNASRRDHEELRDWVKPFLLGIHYGLTMIGAAARLKVSLEEAARYLEMHQRLFPTYWKWSADYVDVACERRVMQSRWGWRLQIPGGESRSSRRDIKRSLKNHPIQTMGAHILHFAEIGLTESGIRVCCPVHDAVLWESTLEKVDADAVKVERIMRSAAKAALGIEIPVDHKIVRHALDADARYMDKRGRKMFEKATAALKSIEAASSVRGDIGQGIKDIEFLS